MLQAATQTAATAILFGWSQALPAAAQSSAQSTSTPVAAVALATTAAPKAAAVEASQVEARIQRLAGRAARQVSAVSRVQPVVNPAPAASAAPVANTLPIQPATPMPPQQAIVERAPVQVAQAMPLPVPNPVAAYPAMGYPTTAYNAAPPLAAPTGMPPSMAPTMPSYTYNPPIAYPPSAPSYPTAPGYAPPLAYGGGYAQPYAPQPYAPQPYAPQPMPYPAAPAYPTAYAPPAAYGQGYGINPIPMAYPIPALPQMPTMPSPYAGLQTPYGNLNTRLTPPVARMRSSYPAPMVAQQPQYPQPQYPQPSYPSYGQPVYPSYSQPAYGQPAYGQPYAPPAYGQPVYGQPVYGQPAYGQPSYMPPAPIQVQPQTYGQPYVQPQAPQAPLPQLGNLPPAVNYPLNAPLAVPVTKTGLPAPSTDSAALKDNGERPLLRSTSSNRPSVTLQGVYQYQADESSARGRLSASYPLSPRLLFGATFDVSTGSGFTDSPRTGFNVNELFLATSLPELPNLRFAAGQMDMTSYFDRNSFAKDGASHFFNPAFQTNAALAAAGLGSRPGLLVNWSLSDNIEAKAAAFSSSRGLSEFSLNAFAGELGIRYGNAIVRGTYVSGRDSGNLDSFREAFLVDRGQRRFGLLKDDRETGLGINGEVFIPKYKMGVFARYGRYNNVDAGEGADTYGLGVSFLDVFSRDDRLGLAYGSNLTNEKLRRQSGQPKADVLELFYDFRFLPNLRLGFSLQNRNDFSEIVAGVRVKTEFDVTPKGRLMQ
jgi:hypothetical protein